MGTEALTGRRFYAVEKDITDRDEAALVCAVVLDVLAADLAAVSIDAYSDYDPEMPDEIRSVQATLKEIGSVQHGRDPGMGIDLDLSDPMHARLLELFAPWSINVDLLGPRRLDMGCFHDCALGVHFLATPEQAAEITARLITVGPVVSMDELDERRREQRQAIWAARRAAIVERARRVVSRLPRIGKRMGWPTITPPTVPPAGPPPFDSTDSQPVVPRDEDTGQ